ncbi:hypothetical protein CDL12_05817 [Handroanthus impetiginosus]|uniref:RING-type E3 ubiquitin transferase n=1 Tax=Handroanthus impetiginosus TaxID=429701 RepID=A0A2G9HVC4_9LAMI|nr:hypothetical protein CDL12_05817 [Handroanthus impetiginosus]
MDSINSPPMTQSSRGTLFMSPLMISMLGIVVTSTAITLYHLFLIKYCMRRHGGVTSIMTPRLTDGSCYTGIQPNVLEKIPIFTFSVVKRKIDQDECVVCLGELEDEDKVRLLPLCKHAFHVKCIDQWFQRNANCPICRSIPGETNVEFSLESHRTNDLDPEGGESSPSHSSRDSSSPRAQSFGLLRHCVSLVLPPTADMRSPLRLKRSFSMDQSFVVVNVQNDTASSSDRGMLTRSRSLSPFGRVPSKWLKSFSRLRVGKGSSNVTILPH